MTEVEEVVKRLQSHKGVCGVLVTNNEGIPIRSTMDPQKTNHYGIMNGLVSNMRNMVKELDPSNELQFLRIRTKHNELMIAPDKEYKLLVVQEPQCE